MEDTQEFRDALQAESLRRFPGNSKDAKKKRKGFRNAERQRLGFKKEGRGGVAGFYDRNKSWLVPVAAGAAGLFTGGLAAPMVVGAAARGLDREGEGGIGFDVGQGLRGAVEGAAAGSGATALSGAVNAARMGAAGASGAGLNPVWGAARGVGEAARDVLAPMAVTGQAGGSAADIVRNRANWLPLAQGALTAYNRAQALELARRGVRVQEREWNANAPLRVMGRQGLLNPAGGNPFDAPMVLGGR